MGCDIHMILEVKANDKWIGLNTFQYFSRHAVEADMPHSELPHTSQYFFWLVRARNYTLFGKLAGVRTDGPEPRGVPEDASELARMIIEDWDCDGHSHSWGLLSEIGGLFLATYEPNKMVDDKRVDRMLGLFGLDEEAEPENYRLVYFFDN